MTKMLKKDEELALARAWLERSDERARGRLVVAYQPMIRNIARKNLRSGLSLDDLIQEGNIGFMAGLDNFDPDRGYSVGTLARFHIAARIQLHVSEFTGIIRLPNSRRIKGLLSQCVAKIRAAEAEAGETISQARKKEICEAAGFELEELEQFEMVMRPTKSLAIQKSDSDEESGFEVVDETGSSEDVYSSTEALEKTKTLLAGILADMPERTRTIITMRHLGEEFVSLDSIAATVGISRERVRRIERDALGKIQEALKDAGIEAFSDLI